VVGDITFSQPFGYMEQGRDFDGTLADSKMAMTYLAVVGQVPILDFFVAQNPLLKLFVPAPFTTVNDIARKRLMARLAEREKNPYDGEKDFLDSFIAAREEYPDVVNPGQMQSYLLINLIAGADTTASTLATVFYYALRHPSVWAKLEVEILKADLPTKDGNIAYRDARTLPYLDAVVREAQRVLPGVGMPLERYVPAEGLRLPHDNSLVPAGSIVGMNPYVINRTASVFGQDVDAFRPERWLPQGGEDEVAYRERLDRMNNTDFTFGLGTRMCGGRHIAALEMYKLIATVVRRYKVELADGGEAWQVQNGWFMRPSGLMVRCTRR
jgi:cytochrome P450